jgi:chromosomal replication initiator protein
VVDQLLEIPLPGRTFAAAGAAPAASRPDAVLPAFVAGPENRLPAWAVRQLMEWCERPRTAPSVVMLFGPSGVGKSHLATGLVRHWQARRGADAAAYITASDFRRSFVEALDRETVAEFRRRCRGRQLLVIDDLQFLPADSCANDELRATIDAYRESTGVLLVTATRAAAALANLPDDVRSRLSEGLVLPLAAPGPAARQQILRQAAHALRRPLSEAVAGRLAAGVAGSTNELIGALFELLADVSATAAAEEADVARLLAARAERRPSLPEILGLVARHYRLPQKVLRSASRKHAVVVARSTVVALARELAGASYEEIGRALGGRDHTTIMHNHRTIERERKRDWQTQETLEELRRILSSR